MLKRLLNFILIGLASIIFVALLSSPARAANFSVNTTTDTNDASAGDGTCADSGGACSLRAATEEANALAGDDVVNIPNGTYSLVLNSLFYNNGNGSVSFIGQSTAGVIIDGGGNQCFGAQSNGATKTISYQNLTIQNMATQEDICSAVQFHETQVVLDRVEVRNITMYGLYFYSSLPTPLSLTIKNSYIHNITVLPDVYGVYIDGNFNATIEGSTIGDSTQAASYQYVTGIEIRSGATVNITNSTIANNINTANPAIGLKVINSTVNLVNVTIAYNTGNDGEIPGGGGGMGIVNSTVTARNVLIASNIISGDSRNCSGAITSLGGNMSSDNTCATQFNLPTDHNNIDPQLGDFGLHGGLTPTYALLPGSPAINAGVDADGMTADQRGVGRNDGSFDIGAYEFIVTEQSSSVATTTSSQSSSKLPTVGVIFFGLPVILAMIVTFSFVYVDYRHHRFALQAGTSGELPVYTFQNHVRYVTIPRVQYRLAERLSSPARKL